MHVCTCGTILPSNLNTLLSKNDPVLITQNLSACTLILEVANFQVQKDAVDREDTITFGEEEHS